METDDRLLVNGIAIRPCISRNGVKYTKEELIKFAPTMEGRPILVDHQHNDVTKNVGLVTKSFSDNEGIVRFEGWIKDPEGIELKERLQDGRLKEVSIGAIAGKMVKEHDDDNYVLALDLESLETSVISCAGVKDTKISQSFESFQDLTEEELTAICGSLGKNEEENVQDEPKKVQNDEIKKEENIMADEQKPDVPVAEAAPVTPPVKENIDASMLEATKMLLAEVKTLKGELSELKNAKEKSEAAFKTKDAEVAKVVESCDGYCMEESAKGLGFWKMPGNKGKFANDTEEAFRVRG